MECNQNYWTVHGHLLEKLPHQSVSITCPKSPIDDPKQFRECFYIDTTIGGRFSVTSVVGGLITSVVYGPTYFDEILEGAYQLDQMAHCPLEKNISLLAACLTIYCNLCDYNARAIILIVRRCTAFLITFSSCYVKATETNQ